MNILTELLEGWRYTRAGVIDEVANLPAERLWDRPAGVQRSALELAEHIVVSGWLMAGELSRPDGDFQRRSYPELLAEHAGEVVLRDRDAALTTLRASQEAGAGRLHAAGLELMERPIRQFSGTFASRISWMHHGIAHEEYHRGQLALYARLLGVTPALTKAILGG